MQCSVHVLAETRRMSAACDGHACILKLEQARLACASVFRLHMLEPLCHITEPSVAAAHVSAAPPFICVNAWISQQACT